jgi:endonuclease/exonuclease/phosphatase family metal-dependent hydrolase
VGARQLVSRVLVASVMVAALVIPVTTATAAERDAVSRPSLGVSDVPPACSAEAPAPGAPAPTADPDPSSIKVGGFNVLFASGTSNASLDARIPLIVDAIHGSGADVVTIAEDELIGSRGHTSERIARQLAAVTGDTWSWCFFMANPLIPGTPDTYVGGGNPASDVLMPVGNTMGESVWRTGIGVVSRYPILDSGAHRLPYRVADEIAACATDLCRYTAQFESRAAMRTLIDAPGGEVQVVSTHLSNTISSFSEVTRLAQANDLLQWIADFSDGSGTPVVLSGDFNSAPDTAAHTAVLDGGFIDTFSVARPGDPGLTSGQTITSPVSTVRSRIDFVFARAGACASPLSSGTGVLGSTLIGSSPQVTDGTYLWPSDHYGVVSEIKPFPDAPDTCPITYTAHFPAPECAVLGRIAVARGGSVADVLRLGVGILRDIAQAGHAAPATVGPNEGPCAVTVAWPAAERAAIVTTAAAWGVTPEQLNQGGGRLVLAIIYSLAHHR